MYPSSTMRPSTKSRAPWVRVLSFQGERLFGLLIRPASAADSPSVNSRAGLPKYPFDAASTPYNPLPR